MLEEREREFLTTRECKADEASALRALGLPLVGPEEWLKTQKGEVYLTKPGLLMEATEKRGGRGGIPADRLLFLFRLRCLT